MTRLLPIPIGYTASLVPRPPRPAFVACSMKSGGRPGQTYHMMRATAELATIDPVAIRLAGQTEQKEQTEFLERRQKGRGQTKIERDISSGMHHVINPSSSSPRFSYCK